MPPKPAVTPHSPGLAPVILENNWRLPRRSFLKGAGAMLGLPLLEAMGKVSAVAAPDALASTKAAPIPHELPADRINDSNHARPSVFTAVHFRGSAPHVIAKLFG